MATPKEPKELRSGGRGGSAPEPTRSVSGSAGAGKVKGGAKQLGGSRCGDKAGPQPRKSGGTG